MSDDAGFNKDRSTNSHPVPRVGYKKPGERLDFADPEILGDRAWDWAIYIADPKLNHKNQKWESHNLTSNQVRRYYSEFKNIQRSMLLKTADKLTDENWIRIYSKIKLLNAKAVYDSKRQSGTLPITFREFIEMCVRAISSVKNEGYIDFNNICLFFEAVVGYSSEYTKK